MIVAFIYTYLYNVITISIAANFPIKKIHFSGFKLYYLGRWNKKVFEKSLAVVGSRRITRYGQQVIDQIVPDLVAAGITIISGFMYGVDTAAHQKCLEYGGRTVAVLGNGLNIIYPPENERLYQKIIDKRGLIISEYEPDQKPHLWTYPQRNRIIAKLASLGTLIIEAGENSGSLITARLTKKNKKPLFAVPGPITSSTSVGSNWLIKTGQAKMVTQSSDILSKKSTKNTLGVAATAEMSGNEAEIIRLLQAEPLTIDEIALKIKKNIIETSQILTTMTIKGLVEEKEGKYIMAL